MCVKRNVQVFPLQAIKPRESSSALNDPNVNWSDFKSIHNFIPQTKSVLKTCTGSYNALLLGEKKVSFHSFLKIGKKGLSSVSKLCSPYHPEIANPAVSIKSWWGYSHPEREQNWRVLSARTVLGFNRGHILCRRVWDSASAQMCYTTSEKAFNSLYSPCSLAVVWQERAGWWFGISFD